MARQGQVIDLGNSGVRMTIMISANDTNGQLSQVEAVMQGGKKLPALPHYHPSQEERFDVLSGQLTTVVDGKTRQVGAGESLIIYDDSVSDKMQMAVVADYYRDFMALRMPLKAVVKVMAVVGRMRGKHGYLPEYFDE